ncbi:AEC family transporter [Tolumonas lignilytica]|jgi:Predicted permeases|uniref:AEC family transporter n=1 Tax=Tolumonas lignilytica TaxID=1283284 RepID=UPI000464FB59|nr:AEC family transporter [Tolumonas lignilytica]
MSALLHQIYLSTPLFILVFLGYGVMRWARWPQVMSESLSRFVFSLALPAMLFHLMSDFSKLPPVDARLLIAFFGGCLIVFILGRFLAWKLFKLDGVSQSVFALGGIFSNNSMLGLPLAKMMLGDAALPSVALVLVFNSLILWTLVTISVELAKHGSFSFRGFFKTVKTVLRNPIVFGILTGTAWGLTGWKLPLLIDNTVGMISNAAAPMALLSLGMGLAEYGIGGNWGQSISVCLLKLIGHPLAAWGIARLIGLPVMETQAIVLLASIATGVNVYLMARQFKAMEGVMATSLLLSTVMAAITTPLCVMLSG